VKSHFFSTLKLSPKIWVKLLFWGLMVTAFYFRASGLFHGLKEGHIFHPDSPKQVLKIQQNLEGDHVTYHDSLFYDGYPYGLNRVDEVILRTLRGIIAPGYRLLHGQDRTLPIPDRDSGLPPPQPGAL
jgi:hypothetical protein